MPAIKTVGICLQAAIPRSAAALVPQLVEWLRARGIAIRCG